MTWERFTRAVTFLLGVAILVMTVVGDPVEWGLVVIALVLMGVTSLAQVLDTVARTRAPIGPDESMAGPVPHSGDLTIVDEPSPPLDGGDEGDDHRSQPLG